MHVYVCQFISIFSSETTGPIETEFHVEPPSDGLMKVYLNRLGQMTNMAAVAMYHGKDLKSLLLWNQQADDLESWHASFGTRVILYQVCSNDDPGLTLTILQQGQIWSIMLSYGKKEKQWIFSETIVVYDTKVSRCS